MSTNEGKTLEEDNRFPISFLPLIGGAGCQALDAEEPDKWMRLQYRD